MVSGTLYEDEVNRARQRQPGPGVIELQRLLHIKRYANLLASFDIQGSGVSAQATFIIAAVFSSGHWNELPSRLRSLLYCPFDQFAHSWHAVR
jgi:hypothetical protein